MKINVDERIDDLECGGLKIIQNKNRYCFSNDAVLLANFAKAKKGDCVVELCAGSGVISILMSAKTNASKFYLVEIQEDVANMCKKSIELNNLQEKMEVIDCDVNNVKNYLVRDDYDVVVANPPYKEAHSHKLSNNENFDLSRYELKLSLNQLIKSASKLLKFGGKFYFIHDASRLNQIFSALNEFNLKPKVLQFVHAKGKNSHVVLIEAVKGAKDGLIVKPSVNL